MKFHSQTDIYKFQTGKAVEAQGSSMVGFGVRSVLRAATLFVIFLFVGLFGFVNKAYGQDAATLYRKGAAAICNGSSTTIAVSVDASVGPYTVVYSAGGSTATVTKYVSNESGDASITVTPTTTTTYSLVSVTDFYGSVLEPLSSATVTITVNPNPSVILVTLDPVAPVCRGVDFKITASATNGSTYQLWDSSNTTKIADIVAGPTGYTTNILTSTNFYVRAIGIATTYCTTSLAYTVTVDNEKPTITCPSNQNLNTSAGCNATLPDYTGSVTVSDNCTATNSITITQSPIEGTTLSGGHNSTQLVTMTATDLSGNSQTCTFTVTVKDVTAPVFTVTPVSISKNTDPSQCYYTVVDGDGFTASATDNCGILRLTYKINGSVEFGSTATTTLTGVQLTKGDNVIIWTAYDINENTSTSTFTVTVVDNQKPTITNPPSDQNLNMNSGSCTATIPNYITLLSIAATDNCGTESITLTQDPIATTVLSGGDGSTQTITITATDASGNATTCTFTVTVQDIQPPTITPPSNYSVNNDNDQCTASVTIPNITFGDNCSTATLTWTTTGATVLSGDGQLATQTYNIGITTIHYTVTDGASPANTVTCTSTVTVTDNQKPTISCPSDKTVANDNNSCTASVEIPTITFADNCTTATLTWTTTGATVLSGDGQLATQTYNIGITTIHYTITDGASPANTVTCTSMVTVTDSQIPSITSTPTISVSNDNNLCTASVVVPDATFGDNCSGSTLSYTITGVTTGSGSGQVGTKTFNVGVSTITYTVSDTSSPANTATCTTTVTVTDTQKPLIAGCPANITRTSSAGLCTATVSWTEPTATDNCTASGSLIWVKSHTSGTSFPAGTTTVTYTATDAASNTSTCTFTVTVTDNQKPVISGCPSNITIANTTGYCYGIATWTEPTAIDNCSATNTLTWTKSGTSGVTQFPIGTTVVTYTVSDGATVTNTASCSFNVTVTESEKPTAVCKPATIYLNSSGVATLSVTDVNNGSSDNCTAQGSLVITLSKTTFNCLNKGANTVVMTVKDAAGNQSTCSSTVTVLDNIAPTLSATAGTVTASLNASTGKCYYTIIGSEFDPSVTDNCIGSTMSYTITGATTLSGTGSIAGIQLQKGVNEITWTAKDASNNTASNTITFTKTVVDNQAPVISAKPNQDRNTNTGCGYTTSGSEFDVTVTDNCTDYTLKYAINGASLVTASTLSGTVFQKGVNSVSWVATDGANTTTGTFQITVADDDYPVFTTTINNITQNVDPGYCYAVVTWTEPTATDNCGTVTPTQIVGPTSGSTFPSGVTAIRYRVTDSSGQNTDMSFTVTVRDNTAPAITCLSSSTAESRLERSAVTGLCGYTVSGTEFDATAVKSCSLSLINSYDGSSSLAGKQLPVGNTNIVWTASNGTNSSTCTVYVKITDSENPTFSQPTGDHPRVTDPDECFFTVPGTEFDLSNVSDNCETQQPTYIITKDGALAGSSVTTNTGTTADTGTNTLAGLRFTKDAVHPYSIVWTLMDGAGNTVTSTAFTITITDNQSPTFVCYGNETRPTPADACVYTISGTEFDPTAKTDNCDPSGSLTTYYTLDGVGGTTTYTSLAGVTLTKGVHPVVWTITDLSGNAASCTFTISVVDLTAPTISPTITDQERTAVACGYTASGTEFDPVSFTDNCTGATNTTTLTNNLNSLSTLAGYSFPVGITVVVWTATDASGNVTTMQFNVTIKDYTKPTFTLTATANKNTDTGCYYVVNGKEFDPSSINDDCSTGNYTITNDYNSNRTLERYSFSVGTTTVTWSVTDNSNNTTTKTIVITVTDISPPTITCPGSAYNRIADQGKAYYTVGADEFKPAASDVCSIKSYTHNYGSASSTTTLTGTRLNAGTYSITWTATDTYDNTNSCTVTINVTSDLYPSISCVGDQTLESNTSSCTFTVSGTGYDATSTSPAATITNSKTGTSTLNGAVFSYGTTLVTWTATQTVNGTVYTNKCSSYIFVTDTQKPAITPPANVIAYTDSDCNATSVSLGTPVTSDNCAVDHTDNNAPSTYSLGITTVTWWVEDVHGNTATATQTVTVIDNVPPSISCPSAYCREADDPGSDHYTVHDNEFKPDMWENCSTVTYTNSYNSTNSLLEENLPLGTTTITWTAIDAAGNQASCVVTILVSSTTNPPVTCHGNQDRNTDPGVCTYTVNSTEFDVTTTGTFSPTLTYSNSFNSLATLAGALLPRGTTTITWTVSDGTTTNTCCTFNVDVNDNQPPVVTFPANLDVDINDGCYASNLDEGTPSAIDNCGAITTVTYSGAPAADAHYGIGVTNIYWSAQDGNGHYVYHTQTVTVRDNIAPVITCPATTYYREIDNQYVSYYTINGDEFTPAASDNCNLRSYINIGIGV